MYGTALRKDLRGSSEKFREETLSKDAGAVRAGSWWRWCFRWIPKRLRTCFGRRRNDVPRDSRGARREACWCWAQRGKRREHSMGRRGKEGGHVEKAKT